LNSGTGKSWRGARTLDKNTLDSSIYRPKWKEEVFNTRAEKMTLHAESFLGRDPSKGEGIN